MMNNQSASSQKIPIILLSGFIFLVISLQSLLTFRVFCPNQLITFIRKNACGSALYPFTDYHMYHAAHYEGDRVEQFFVFATLADDTEVAILPEDLELNFWLFRQHVILPLLEDDGEKLKTAIDLYEGLHQQQITALRLENQPVVITKEGMKSAPTQVLKIVSSQEIGE